METVSSDLEKEGVTAEWRTSMTFHIEYEAREVLDFNYEELLRRVMEECLDYEDCPYETEISLLLTDNEEIKEINKEYRNIDSATDVLSFPTIEYQTPGDFSDLEEAEEEYFHPETGELILGDIVISVERAIEQSEEFGHSILRELAFLTAHSMLHLMGYDHMEEEERSIMEAKQEEILQRLEIFR